MSTSVYITKEQLQSRVKELAKEIEKDLGDDPNVIAICVLRGAFIFFTDLIRNIEMDIKCDFIQCSSYEGTKSSQKPALSGQFTLDFKDQTILIVEDIADTGATFNTLCKELEKYKPKKILTVALLDKKQARTQDFKPDYTGFEISNDFVIGYGLDYNQKYRNLPYIAKVKDVKAL